mmetsp:Transcript_11900/g.28258  ORF Transcript_11900/g.28258 Transcript_11900/m.28258 type:complete len:275 (-) Transcript_11900:92-916(-)
MATVLGDMSLQCLRTGGISTSQRQGKARRQVVVFAGTEKSKTVKIKRTESSSQPRTRKTKKIELSEETLGTLGAVGVFGFAVATAGYLFTNNTVEIEAPPAEQVVRVPEPERRSAPLPTSDAGPKIEAGKQEVVPEATPKPSNEVIADKKPISEEPNPKGPQFGTVPAPAPTTLQPTSPPSKPPASAEDAASSEKSSTGSVNPAVVGGGALALVAVAAIASQGSGSAEDSASPAAPAPAQQPGKEEPASSPFASMDARKEDRKAWIAAWRGKQK